MVMTLMNAKIENLIIDMDGVLWHGDTPVSGLAHFFETLRHRNIAFVLATNNATKVATQYSEKLAGFGVDIPPSQILNSAEATAIYLREHFQPGATVYVIGTDGLRKAVEAQEFRLLAGDGFVGETARVDAVVVGLTRDVCYGQLASATHLINQGAAFIGTNPDVTFPSELGNMPGAGALIAFVQTATDVEPIIIGKPNRAIFEESMRLIGGNTDNTVMVGDRLATDIAGAQAAGLRTILLMSGVTGPKELEASTVRPDWIFDNLSALTQFLIRQGSTILE
jgi:4-nitrophenyl phosphatase